MLDHPDSFLKKYDWDYFIARRNPQIESPPVIDRRHLSWVLDVFHAGKFADITEAELLAAIHGGSSPSGQFAYLDADQVTVEDVEQLLAGQPVCVMVHHTNTDDGCAYLKWRFQTTAPYFCLEDQAPSGDKSGRGMFFATSSLELFAAARASLARWGRFSVPEGVGPPTP